MVIEYSLSLKEFNADEQGTGKAAAHVKLRKMIIERAQLPLFNVTVEDLEMGINISVEVDYVEHEELT